MNSGSTLLGWDDSPTNVMRTLFSKLQLGSLDINLSMAWVYSGTPPYGHLGNTVTSLLQVYVDCWLWNWNLPDNSKVIFLSPVY